MALFSAITEMWSFWLLIVTRFSNVSIIKVECSLTGIGSYLFTYLVLRVVKREVEIEMNNFYDGC